MKHTYLTIALLYCAIPFYLKCTEKEIEHIARQDAVFADNAALIFLDDSEGNDYFGAMSSDLLSALIKNAGPIIVSGSLISNIKEKRVPQEKDPNKLLKRFNVIEKKYGEITDQEYSEQKSIILSAGAFTPEVAQNWIIKEINPFLYLLLPKDYLKKKKITNEQVETIVTEKTITSTEQALGLKVNHMKTVTINDVKKQETSPEFANYFVDSLNTIFVINSEYIAQKSKEETPAWALYISGHGESKHSIACLSLQQFKDFLIFLTKITIRLLVYTSCYAAGVNAQLVYKENQKDLGMTYPFTIIAQALTDASTASLFISMDIVDGKLEVKPEIKFDLFLNMVTTAQTIDYRKLIELVNNTDYKKVGFAALPQIKLPGVPWFSVLDNDKTLSIGSILAKTRTAPLDVGTFSKKDANPLVILVYAQDIPFELIINTKTIETNAPPAIISMVTGNVVHYFKKISSKKNTIEALLNSFLTLLSDKFTLLIIIQKQV